LESGAYLLVRRNPRVDPLKNAQAPVMIQRRERKSGKGIERFYWGGRRHWSVKEDTAKGERECREMGEEKRGSRE
jgi:hypothetical protein